MQRICRLEISRHGRGTIQVTKDQTNKRSSSAEWVGWGKFAALGDMCHRLVARNMRARLVDPAEESFLGALYWKVFELHVILVNSALSSKRPIGMVSVSDRKDRTSAI